MEGRGRAARAAKRSERSLPPQPNPTKKPPKAKPPKAKPPAKTKPQGDTIEEKCLKYGIKPHQTWAFCALDPNCIQSNKLPATHARYGKCFCEEKRECCRRCCGNCPSGKTTRLGFREVRPTVIEELDERETKVAAVQKIEQASKELAKDVHHDDDSRKPIHPPPQDLKDIATYFEVPEAELWRIPDPKNLSTKKKAQDFFDSNGDPKYRLLSAMAKGCMSVVKVASCRSPDEAVRAYTVEVGQMMVKWGENMQPPAIKETPQQMRINTSPTNEPSLLYRGSAPTVVTPDSEADAAVRNDLFENESEPEGNHLSGSSSEDSSDDSTVGEEMEVNTVGEEIEPSIYNDVSVEQKAIERDRMCETLIDVCKSHWSHRRRPVFRLSRGTLVHCVKPAHLNMVKKERKKPSQKKKHRLFGYKAREKGQADIREALAGGDLMPPQITRQRISDFKLGHAVKYMLSVDNVGLWSWGKKTVTITSRNGGRKEIFVLPRVFTRKAPQDIYRHYINAHEERVKDSDEEEALQSPDRPIGKSLFMDILSNVTSGDSKMITAVDYVTAILLHDNCNTLLRIIKEQLGGDEEMMKTHIENLEIVRNFLKVQYIEHARKEGDNCPSHGVVNALSQPQDYAEQYLSSSETNTDTEDERGSDEGSEGESGQDSADATDDSENDCQPESSCSCCNFVYQMIRDLKEDVNKVHHLRLQRIIIEPSVDGHMSMDKKIDDINNVLDDAGKKFHTFMAHKCRVARQQDEAARFDEEMEEEVRRSRGRGTRVKIVADWKMKWNARSKSEGSNEHYAKRGNPWHAFYAYYYEWVDDASEASGGYLQRVNVKLDQLMDGDNNQNGEAVLTMVEAMLLALEEKLPFLETATLCSDNAQCYHTFDFVFGLIALNLMKGRKIRIDGIFHSETQDGKGLVDAHLSHGTRQVLKYIKCSPAIENKKVGSPSELAKALAWNGGLPNSCVQHIMVNRPRLSDVVSEMAKCIADAKAFFSRANKIEFKSEGLRRKMDASTSITAWLAEVDFVIQVWAYSGIGNGATFEGSFGEDGSFRLVEVDDVAFAHMRTEEEDESDDASLVELLERPQDDDDSVSTEIDPWERDEAENPEQVVEDLYNDDVAVHAAVTFSDAEELPRPDGPKYQPENLLTGLDLIGQSAFGEIKGSMRLDGADEVDSSNNNNSKDLFSNGFEGHNGSRDCPKCSEGIRRKTKQERKDFKKKKLQGVWTGDRHEKYQWAYTMLHKECGHSWLACGLCYEKKTTFTIDAKSDRFGTLFRHGIRHKALRSKAAMPRAMMMVNAMVGECVKIHSGVDDRLAVYDKAIDFPLDASLFQTGWGRRPLVGNLYGDNPLTQKSEYYPLVYEMVKAGYINKADKMNPKQMYASLWEQFHLYSLPTEAQIQRSIKTILERIERKEEEEKKEKKGKAKSKRKKAQQPEPDDEEPTEEDLARTFLVEQMKKKLRQHGWETMKPMQAFERLMRKHEKKLFKKKLKKKERADFSKIMRDKFSYMKSQKKLSHKKMHMRAVI